MSYSQIRLSSNRVFCEMYNNAYSCEYYLVLINMTNSPIRPSKNVLSLNCHDTMYSRKYVILCYDVFVQIRLINVTSCFFPNFTRPPLIAVSWDRFAAYMHSANFQILPCSPDRFCFLNSIQLSLAINHKIFTTVQAIKSEIISFLVKNLNHYSNWHEGDILKDTEAYFRTGQFTQSIVDLIIEVSACALNLNLYIYQRGTDGNVSVKEYHQGVNKPDVHVHFHYNPKHDLANHYQPIVKFANNNPEFFTVFIPLSPDSQDSICTTPSSSPGFHDLHKDANVEKYLGNYKFPTHLFHGIEPTVVDYLPHDIDGLKIYRIKVKTKNIWVHASDPMWVSMTN